MKCGLCANGAQEELHYHELHTDAGGSHYESPIRAQLTDKLKSESEFLFLALFRFGIDSHQVVPNEANERFGFGSHNLSAADLLFLFLKQ